MSRSSLAIIVVHGNRNSVGTGTGSEACRYKLGKKVLHPAQHLKARLGKAGEGWRTGALGDFESQGERPRGYSIRMEISCDWKSLRVVDL